MTKMFKIRGDYADAGYRTIHNSTMEIEHDGEDFREYELGRKITATQFGRDPVEIQAEGCSWAFWPDDGECERIGLPVTQLA